MVKERIQIVFEAVNLYAILIIISLFGLPLPVALKMAVVCCYSEPAFCTAEDEEGEKVGPGLLGRSS